VTEIETPPSLATAMRSAFAGSIHMSWLSPPGLARPVCATSVAPPSIDLLNAAVRWYVSFSFAVETAMRE
jgi:hypothetical protein